MSFFTTPFNWGLEFLAILVRLGKEIKGMQIGKEEIKLSVFTDYLMVYVASPKEMTQKTETNK